MADEFQGESGLKEDWDGTIVESRFEQQGRGNWALVLKSVADDGEEVEHRPLSVGGVDKGWVSHDGGEEIMGPSEKSRFQERSTVQQFINRVMATDANPVLRGRSADSFNHRGPMHAALWTGLRFHWDVVKEMQDRQQTVAAADGSTVQEWVPTEVTLMVPTRYLGEAGAPAATPTTPTPATTATSPTPPPSDNGGIPDADLTLVKTLAVSHDDWGEFAEAVMATAGADGTPLVKNPAIRRNLAKRDWWSSLRG